MSDETRDPVTLAAYGPRNRVQHAVLADEPSFVRPILRSRFFERKKNSEDAAGLVTDFDVLFAAIGSCVPVEDAPLVWLQWLRYGHIPENVSALLERVRRGEPPDPLTIRAVLAQSERTRLRYAIVASSPGSLPASLLPEAGIGSLDSYDLGGVVAALTADARRGSFDPAASAALPGFDCILAWLLAGRGSSIPGARLGCWNVALDIAERAQGDAPLRCLTWLASVEPAARAACLARVGALLRTVSSDALLPAVLGAVDDVTRGLDPSTPGAGALAQAVSQSALHCLRPSAVIRALARASVTLASLGLAESENLLRLAVQKMRETKAGRGSDADECALLLARARLIPLRRIADPGAAQNEDPSIQAALAALHVAEANEEEARKILRQALRTSFTTPEPARISFIEVIGEILAHGPSGGLRQDFQLAAASVIELLPNRVQQVAALASALGAEPEVVQQIAIALGGMSDYRERIDALAPLAETPYAGFAEVLDLVLDDMMRASDQNDDQPAMAKLARFALLGGRSGSLSPWLVKRHPSGARRSLAAALMPSELSAAADWVGQTDDHRTLPARASVGGVVRAQGAESVRRLETLVRKLVARNERVLWEALALAFRHYPAFAPPLAKALAALPEPSPTFTGDDMVRTEAHRAEVLALAGCEDAAIRAVGRVLAACRHDPTAAIRVHQELFVGAPAFLARSWIERVTTDLLNQHSAADSGLKAIISNQMALHLPTDEAQRLVTLLFLGSANVTSPGEHHLAMSWLARCGHKHCFRFVLEDKDDTLLAHCRRFLKAGVLPLGIDSQASFCLATAAENLCAIGEWQATAQLIKQALQYLHRSVEGDGTPFQLADAWIGLYAGARQTAEALWSEFQSKLSGRLDGREAAIVCEAEARRLPWADAVRGLTPTTLAWLVRRASMGGAPLSPSAIGALLAACRGKEDLADVLCSHIIMKGDPDLACLRVLLTDEEE